MLNVFIRYAGDKEGVVLGPLGRSFEETEVFKFLTLASTRNSKIQIGSSPWEPGFSTTDRIVYVTTGSEPDDGLLRAAASACDAVAAPMLVLGVIPAPHFERTGFVIRPSDMLLVDRREWTRADVRALRHHNIVEMRRTVGDRASAILFVGCAADKSSEGWDTLALFILGNL